jgi:hypothetical protein
LILPAAGIRLSKRGYIGATSKVETLKVTTMTRIARSAAATVTIAAALICFNVSPSQAQYYGDAPWCAVVSVGTGSVTWNCYYQTVEACVPNVLAGNRGFCGLNPYYTGARQGAVPVTRRQRSRSRRH